MLNKICRICGAKKSIGEFRVRNKKSGCRRTECKKCLVDKGRERIHANKEHYTKYWREWNRKHDYKIPVNDRNYEFKYAGKCGLGRKYELLVLSLLPGAVDINFRSFKNKYDVLYNNLKIDIKMVNLSTTKDGWGFSGITNFDIIDGYILFCVENGVIKKTMYVPADIIKKHGGNFWVGHIKSKKDIYKINLSNMANEIKRA